MKLIHKLLFMLGTCVVLGGMAQAAVPAGCTYTAGYQVFSIPNQPGGSNGGANLPLAVWYPSSGTANTYNYWSNISGQVALNGPISQCGGPFPLVVFSHGYSGCGTQSVFLTEELARQGYVVAAPDHQDHGCSINNVNNPNIIQDFNPKQFLNPTTWTPDTGSYRNIDIESVVNWMLSTSGFPFVRFVDPNRIAMSGHSFGGYTTFAKIGGWSSWYDARFKAALMLSPYIQPFTYNHLVGVPTVPQFYYGGICDSGITPWMTGNNSVYSPPGAYQQASFPPAGTKYFAELDNPNARRQICADNTPSNSASHFAFSNDICFTAANPTTVQACLSNVLNAALIEKYSEAFLDSALSAQGNQRWSNLLTTPADSTLLNTYWNTAAIPGGSYVTGVPSSPMSIAAIKGQNLAPTQDLVPSATPTGMPTNLSGVSVSVDGGVSAPLYGVDPAQINFVVPAGLGSGNHTLTVMSGATPIAWGPLTVNTVSPALFLIGNPQGGYGWGYAQQSSTTTPQNCTPPVGGTYYCSIFNNGSPVPIDVSGGNTYLILAANGLRYAGFISATVGGVTVNAQGFASPLYEGIDQVNIGPLPSSLAGKGTVSVVVTASSMQSNAATVVIQ